MASEERFEEGALLLLLHGAEVDVVDNKGFTPLLYAVEKGLVATVAALLERGASTNAVSEDGWNALQLAASTGRTEIVSLLLKDRNIDVNSPTQGANGSSPLHLAAWQGHSSTVRLLLTQEGIQVNARAARDLTPLHVVALPGDPETIRLLLAGGADPTLVDLEGRTALDLAQARRHLEAVEMLTLEMRKRSGTPTSPAGP